MGPGITDKAKEKIFDLFYTDENRQVDSKRGLGLGLSLCKKYYFSTWRTNLC